MTVADHASTEAELKLRDSQDSPLGDISFKTDPTLSCDDGLPPVDRGRHAWLFLLASAMLEALVWGEFHVQRQH